MLKMLGAMIIAPFAATLMCLMMPFYFVKELTEHFARVADARAAREARWQREYEESQRTASSRETR